MSARSINVCVLSEVPRLYETLCGRLKQLPLTISSVDPTRARGGEPELRNAEVLVTEPHWAPLWLYGLSNLKVVLGTWAGVDSIMRHVKSSDLPGFTYCRIGGEYNQAMSEYVVGHVIAHERQFKLVYEEQKRRVWSEQVRENIHYTSRQLNSLSIGILGLGEIGRHVAKVCKAFGMKVWGLVTTIPEEGATCPHVDHYRTSDGLADVLENCDYVCSILPSTAETRGMLDGDTFRHCQARRSVFINVGRGDVCTEDSILKALEEGWLRAAILDVFASEPLASESRLWTHPGVTVTPHCAAVSTSQLITEQLALNIQRHVEGRDYRYPIDWRKGY